MPADDVDPWEPLRSELAADVRRVADRLRSLSQTRLAGPPAPSEAGFPDHPSRAAAARAAASALAGAAATLEGIAAPPLPELGDFAAGDQVAVTGHDLLAAMTAIAPDAHGRETVAVAAAALADVRRRL